jgi:hypothetical protein
MHQKATNPITEASVDPVVPNIAVYVPAVTPTLSSMRRPVTPFISTVEEQVAPLKLHATASLRAVHPEPIEQVPTVPGQSATKRSLELKVVTDDVVPMPALPAHSNKKRRIAAFSFVKFRNVFSAQIKMRPPG